MEGFLGFEPTVDKLKLTVSGILVDAIRKATWLKEGPGPPGGANKILLNANEKRNEEAEVVLSNPFLK